MRKLARSALFGQLNLNHTITTGITTVLFFLGAFAASPIQAKDDVVDTDVASQRVTQLSQTDAEQAAEEDDVLEEVIVTGTQIRGAAISEALAVSVFSEVDIEALGISSGDELLEAIPEQGQNFQSEAENISGGVNSVRGDIGAFNLRNMGTGNTLALLNGRRMVQAAGFQTELVGGSFVPVNTVNPNEIPVMGVQLFTARTPWQALSIRF